MCCSQQQLDLLLPAIVPVFLYANCDGSFPTCFCVCGYHLKKCWPILSCSQVITKYIVIVEIPSSCCGILILLLFWWTFWHLCCPPVSHNSLLATICVPHSCFFLGVVRAVLCMLVLLWQDASGMKKGRCRGLKGLSAIYYISGWRSLFYFLKYFICNFCFKGITELIIMAKRAENLYS